MMSSGDTADAIAVAFGDCRVIVQAGDLLDGIATLRSATYSFDRFTLEHVGRELLGCGKKIAPN
ncbi:MAG: hypothetical protein C4289_10800, partial [Chloroflexota bacterium]